MTFRARILGCGSSAGVPRLGGGWGACDPAEPKNRRQRCALLLRRGTGSDVTSVLIDTGPDMRVQLLDAGVNALEGVLYTHEHADHTHGIDDLRPFAINSRRKVEVWMDAPTSTMMHRRFEYAFDTPPGSGYPPILLEHAVTHGQTVTVDGPGGIIAATAFELVHGTIAALGYRIGGLAYTPDVNDIPAGSVPFLEGLDTWIIDALRPRPHPSHFSLDEALGWIDRMKPRRAILTNMHNDMDFATLRRDLPAGIEPAYDGLEVKI